MHMPDPTFPPLLTGHAVRGSESAFETACARAAGGELGAGDVVWSRNTALVDLAVILEPDVPQETAVQMLPLVMVALGDCIGALSPPQVGVTFTWPDIVRVNGAVAGAFRAAAGGPREAQSVAPWMVLGLTLRHMRGSKDPEPGLSPEITWLSEEGCGELTRTDIIESYSRHFLTWLNNWSEDGFKGVHESWVYRAEERDQEMTLEHGGETLSGQFLGLDESGNLLLKAGDGVRTARLIDRFAFPDAQAASA